MHINNDHLLSGLSVRVGLYGVEFGSLGADPFVILWRVSRNCDNVLPGLHTTVMGKCILYFALIVENV